MSFKIYWYGHAALGLETGGYHILVDPYFTDNPAASTQADQVPADFILVTHGQHLGGGYKYPFGYLKLTFAIHGSALPDGSNGGNPAGFLLTTNDGKKIYLAGDTGLFGDMRLIGEEGLDLAVIPIGDNYTMGPDDALRAVKMLQPRHIIPIHFNTWDVISQDAKAWAARVDSLNSAKTHVLKPGESFEL